MPGGPRDTFREWARERLRDLENGLFVRVERAFDELVALPVEGMGSVHVIGGVLRRPEAEGTGARVSATGVGWSREQALMSCMGEAAEYLSRVAREDRAEGSNGLGAGRDMEAARTHGMLELVERHEVLSWWLKQERRPEVNRKRVEDALKTVPGREGADIWFLWLTGSTGIPTVAALSKSAGAQRVATGFKAARDEGEAIRGAYLELCACILSHEICEARGQDLPETSPDAREAGCLEPEGEHEGGSQGPGGGAEDLEGWLRARGFETRWRDLSDPELGVPVCRVISDDLQAPGARQAVPSLGITDEGKLPERPPIY